MWEVPLRHRLQIFFLVFKCADGQRFDLCQTHRIYNTSNLKHHTEEKEKLIYRLQVEPGGST